MLHGKIALVTGASKGIGSAIAIALAKEGAYVYINYNGSKEKAEEAYYNGQVFWNQSEITNLDVSEEKTRPHERCKPKDRDAR